MKANFEVKKQVTASIHLDDLSEVELAELIRILDSAQAGCPPVVTTTYADVERAFYDAVYKAKKKLEVDLSD